MVLEQKRMLWAFEKSIFQFFANSWVTKFKPFLGKLRKAFRTIQIKMWAWQPSYKNILKQPWAEKRILWAFEKDILQLFASFWVKKFKLFSGKLRQSLQTYLNQNIGITNFLENGFGEKTNVVSIWEKHFSFFCKFLSDNLETIFEKVKQSVQNYFYQMLGIRNF